MPKKIKPYLLGGLGIIALYCGYSMYHAPLWRYQTLFLFLSIWLFVLGVFENKFTKLLRYKQYISYSLISGLLLWLGFPAPGQSYLLLFAFVPLLVVERDISLHHGGVKKREVFKFTLTTMVTWNIMCTYWIANSSLIAGIAAILINSLLMTLPFLLGHVLRHRMPKLQYAPLVCLWLSFEYLHFNWDLAWPWLTLGNGFASMHSLVQWYDMLGALGGSFWIWCCNIAIFRFWNDYEKRTLKKWWSYIPNVLIIIIPILVSLFQYYSFKESDVSLDVVCMQPNIEPHYEDGTKGNIQILEECMEMASAVLDTNTNYILFPEATFGRVDAGYLEKNDIVNAFRMISGMEFPDVAILAGVSGHKQLDASHADLSTTRMSVIQGDSIYYHIFNGAYHIHKQKEDLYYKSKLVIGAEYMPFSKQLGFLDSWVSGMGGTMKGFAKQEAKVTLSNGTYNVAPIICYEQDFGGFLRRHIKNGAQWMAIITKDGWWGDTGGHKQHLEFARLRAIEYRRSIARAANTGTSCFINPRGDISDATSYGEKAVIKQQISLNSKMTNYARMGDMVGRLAAFLSALFIMNAFVASRMKKER